MYTIICRRYQRSKANYKRCIRQNIIYDTVRRDKEIDYKPIYIGKREAKQNEEQTLQKKNDDEIMKMHFAERRFKGNV